ncbi:hypothetical protein [Mesorhizobium sp. M0816]|uniref:hypothetical protein n=1 Tax=Mesorhizobium sp. M0816 TaxID=2957006 RepID=UPI003339772E
MIIRSGALAIGIKSFARKPAELEAMIASNGAMSVLEKRFLLAQDLLSLDKLRITKRILQVRSEPRPLQTCIRRQPKPFQRRHCSLQIAVKPFFSLG